VIILSELVYDEDLHEELLQTLGRALRPGAVAYSGFCDRYRDPRYPAESSTWPYA
jgi:hypothetical protein